MDQNRSTILQQNDISYSFNGTGAINYSTTRGEGQLTGNMMVIKDFNGR